MSKDELLQILKLLSALEGATLVSNTKIPDHLWDAMSAAVEVLEREIKK
jgi:hypothetical protein